MNKKRMMIRILDETREEGRMYVITIAVAVVFIFNLMNIFHLDGSGYSNIFERITYGYSILLVIIFVLTLTFYANNYLLQVKSNEIGIEMLSGLEPSALGMGLTFQSLILNLRGIAIGGIFGVLVVPIFNFVAEANSIFEISSESIAYTLCIMILQTIMLCIINYGFGYTSDINQLINKKESLTYVKETRSNKKFKKIYYCYFFMLISPIILIFFKGSIEKLDFSIPVILGCLSGIGLYKIIVQFIPLYIEKKKGECLNKKIDLIVLNNIKFKLFNSKVIFYVLFFIVLNFILSSGDIVDDKSKLYNDITLVVSLILISFTLIYRILSDTLAQSKFLVKLIFIGYLKEDVLLIVKKDIKSLLLIGAILPSLSVCSYAIPYILYGKLSMFIIMKFFFVYFGILVVCYFITTSISNKILKNEIEGDF